MQMYRFPGLVCGVWLWGVAASAFGFWQSEPAGVGLRESVVDRAVLRGGVQLRGLMVSEKPLRFFMRSEWLKTNASEFFRVEVQPVFRRQDETVREALSELLRKELERPVAAEVRAGRDPVAAKAASASQAARRGLLEDLLERLQADGARSDPEWVLVELPRARVQRLDAISGMRRELGRLGMLNRIPELEVIGAEAVQQQLAGIPESERVFVFEGIAGEVESAERVFERVLAAVDLRSGGAARVIRTGGVCVDEESAGGVSALFGQLLQQNLEGALGELLAEASGGGLGRPVEGEGGVPGDAVAIANRAGRRTMLISMTQMDPATGRAAVAQELHTRGGDGAWRLQLAVLGEASERDIPAGAGAELADDPQVREVAKLAGVLGLGDGELQRAVGMGAVVREALNRSRVKLDEGLQRLLTGRSTGGSAVPLVQLSAEAVGSP